LIDAKVQTYFCTTTFIVHCRDEGQVEGGGKGHHLLARQQSFDYYLHPTERQSLIQLKSTVNRTKSAPPGPVATIRTPSCKSFQLEAIREAAIGGQQTKDDKDIDKEQQHGLLQSCPSWLSRRVGDNSKTIFTTYGCTFLWSGFAIIGPFL
jgi:hypothetical protein